MIREKKEVLLAQIVSIPSLMGRLLVSSIFSSTSAGYNMLAISMDPGSILIADTVVPVPGATAVVFAEGALPTVKIQTGFNEDNGHFNVSGYLTVGTYEEALGELLGLQSRENKRQSLFVVVSATDQVTVTVTKVVER